MFLVNTNLNFAQPAVFKHPIFVIGIHIFYSTIAVSYIPDYWMIQIQDKNKFLKSLVYFFFKYHVVILIAYFIGSCEKSLGTTVLCNLYLYP